MSRTAEASTGRSRVVKAGALSLATVAAASIGLVGCRSVTATSPADVPNGPHAAATWTADAAVSRDRVVPVGVLVFIGQRPPS